jgi:NAD(P)-dependent dehydrogenase (short-subunit alcohol dehydrogenase family)
MDNDHPMDRYYVAFLTDIKATTGCQTLEAWVVDLADFKTVSAFADQYEREGGGRLDLLVMNAGMTTFNYRQTVDGWESTYVFESKSSPRKIIFS